MGEVLNNGVYLPDRGERNAYDGLKGNWNTLDSIAGKVSGYDGHISDADIHVTAADKQTWNGKADASHVHNANDVTTGVFDAARIPNLDASKITTGTIDIDRLPQGALERLVKVADQAARYALTAADVQLGDTVQQLDTGVMYVVTDETKLDSADGYTEYTVGSATSVPWSGVTEKPADYTPASHSHGNITNDGKVGTAANKPLITGNDGVVQAGSFGNAANTFCEGNDSRLSDARTPVAHTHGKADITDLFNSANMWTALNSYNQSIQITANFDIGTAPSSDVYGGFNFGNGSTNIGNVTARVSSAGITYSRLYVSNKYANGALDPNGTLTNVELQVGLKANGNRFIYSNASWDNSLIPYANNTYDLGSSSYQWNNLYAKSYYYNGVAWGLDQANTWTGDNTFSGSNSFNSGLTINNAALLNAVLQNAVKGDVSTTGDFAIFIKDKVNGNAATSLLAVYRGGQDSGGSYAQINIDTKGNDNNRYNNSILFRINPADNNNNAILIPQRDEAIDLGTSTNKWKTLNGINPGALSLPDYNNCIDVTSNIPVASLDGSTQINLNDYLADKTGWLSIVIADTAGNSITVTQGRVGGPTAFNNSRTFHTGAQSNGYISVFFPIIAGTSKIAFIKASSLIQMRFYYCLGNV